MRAAITVCAPALTHRDTRAVHTRARSAEGVVSRVALRVVSAGATTRTEMRPPGGRRGRLRVSPPARRDSQRRRRERDRSRPCASALATAHSTVTLFAKFRG